MEEYKAMAEDRINDKDLVIVSLHAKIDELSGYETLKEENVVMKSENASLKEEITKKYLMELAEIQNRFGLGKGTETIS